MWNLDVIPCPECGELADIADEKRCYCGKRLSDFPPPKRRTVVSDFQPFISQYSWRGTESTAEEREKRRIKRQEERKARRK